jgi:hypothetical protein
MMITIDDFNEQIKSEILKTVSGGRRPHAVLIDGGSEKERDDIAYFLAFSAFNTYICHIIMDFIGRNPLPSTVFGGGILGFNILCFRGGYKQRNPQQTETNLFFTLTNNFKQTHYEKVFLRRIGYRRFGSVRADRGGKFAKSC